MRRFTTAVSALFFVLLSVSNTVKAAIVSLDNSPANGSISPFGVPDSQTYGQVFTAPVTGTLTSFTLWLDGGVGQLQGGVGNWNAPTGNFGFGFGPTSSLYMSAPVPSASAGAYTFTPNVAVVANQRYVAFLTVTGGGANGTTSMQTTSTNFTWIDYFVWNNFGDVGGSNLFDGSWNYFADFGDARFAATFDTAGTPIPAAWLLMLTGLLGFRLFQRRTTA